MSDDWFSVSSLRPIAESHIPIADLVVVPTKPLRDRVTEHFPNAKVEVLEEPVDTQRVLTVADRFPRHPPMIVWCGIPYSQREMEEFGSILGMVHARIPFRLRVVTGHSRPKIDLPLDWEWMPYDYKYEAEQLGGAVAGLAPLQDSPYARCKGTYKVKTYLASGVAPVASPVGHSLQLIRHGENGFFASTPEEWVEILVKLLVDRELVARISREARRDAVEKYSHEALMPVWAERLRHHFPQLGGSSEQEAGRREESKLYAKQK